MADIESLKTMVDVKSLKNALNKWDARILLLISLLFQVLQILFASGRKRNTSKAFTFFTWSIYLLSDWVAIFTLGLLRRSQLNSDLNATTKGNNTTIHMAAVSRVPLITTTSKNKLNGYNGDLLAFWAPFLLLHLGGPDTITAFSMEDNSLWPRHLLELLFQVGTAVYVVLLSLPHNKLLAPTILMFLAGTIKYCERTYALYRSSFDVFRDCIVAENTDKPTILTYWDKRESVSMMSRAHVLFTYFKGIIVDHNVFKDPTTLKEDFRNMESSEAFKLVEYELSLLYDVLYTKAAIVHTLIGYTLRFLSTSLIIVASDLFFRINRHHDYTGIDLWITYILLGGAISLDILAYFMLILSKWTIVRLKELEYRFKDGAPLIIARIISEVVSTFSEWSGSIKQHNLMKAFLPHHGLGRIVDWKSTRSEPIPAALKRLIFQYTKKRNEKQTLDEILRLSTSRGRLALEDYNIADEFRYSVEVRFEKSILMWHIATDICYYTDEGNDPNEHKELSLLLSNYMMYLLIEKLSMIPSVSSWHLMYRETYEDLKSRFSECGHPQNRTPESNKTPTGQLKAYNRFLLTLEPPQGDVSVLRDALIIAKKLKNTDKVRVEDRWKMVSEVWVDILLYAARKCPGIAHAQALSSGGELLTFVRVLFSHFDWGNFTGNPQDFFGEDWNEN